MRSPDILWLLIGKFFESMNENIYYKIYNNYIHVYYKKFLFFTKTITLICRLSRYKWLDRFNLYIYEIKLLNCVTIIRNNNKSSIKTTKVWRHNSSIRWSGCLVIFLLIGALYLSRDKLKMSEIFFKPFKTCQLSISNIQDDSIFTATLVPIFKGLLA